MSYVLCHHPLSSTHAHLLHLKFPLSGWVYVSKTQALNWRVMFYGFHDIIIMTVGQSITRKLILVSMAIFDLFIIYDINIGCQLPFQYVDSYLNKSLKSNEQ